ncbi:MAG: 50S ribosomal protein L11 methyltransferase [Thermodesulfobacteriota bacterium]
MMSIDTTATSVLPEKPDHLAPHDELHIYYIQGRIVDGLLPNNKEFIGNWEEGDFSFLFFSTPADEEVARIVSRQPSLILLDCYRMPYVQWLGEELRPFSVGGFHILPPWEESRVAGAGDNRKIVLDPGVVFGTGTHATTHDCLEALQQLCYKQKIETVLDLGTGTGLLAIAACRLNCRRVLAVDLNFLAARTARRNAALNGMTDRILVAQGRAEDFMDRPADLMISNIHYDVMKELIGSAGFAHHRWFILSGLMRSQARAVSEQLKKLPVTVLKTWERDGIWHTFFGKGLG